MEAINCLRVELAEELEKLPVALQSMFPDLGTDFLYSVFHDVMETSLVCGEGKGVVSCSGRKGRHLERDMVHEEDGSPVAKRTRSSHLKSEEEEEEDEEEIEDSVIEEEKEVEGAWVVMLEDAMGEIHNIHEKLNRMDAASVQYPGCYSSRIRGDRDGNAARIGDDISLMRCVLCNKTIDKSGMEPHVRHCTAKQNITKKEEKPNDVSDSIDKDTSSLGKGQSGEESMVETTKASQNSNTKQGKQTMSNIAPIVINRSDDFAGLPLSPVLKAASSARQGRSSGVRRRRSDPIPSSKPFAGDIPRPLVTQTMQGTSSSEPRPPVGYMQGHNMNARPRIGYVNGMPLQNHTFGHQNAFMAQPMQPQHHIPMMPPQGMPLYQGERLRLNPEQKQFLESQQLRNHIQFLQQQQGMYMMGQGREAMHAPQTAPQYHFGVPPAMGQHPNVVIGRAMNGQHRISPQQQQIYQSILSMQRHANRLGQAKHEEKQT